MNRPAGTASRMLTVIGFIVIIAACYFARGLLLPLAMAALVSLLLAPLVGRVERWGMRRGWAVGMVVFSSFLVVVTFGWAVSLQVPDLTEKLPGYRRNISDKIEAFGSSGQYVRRLTSAPAIAPAPQAAPIVLPQVPPPVPAAPVVAAPAGEKK